MVKLTDCKKLKYYLTHYETGEITNTKWIADQLGISQRRFQQIYKKYCQTKKTPNIDPKNGKTTKTNPTRIEK